METATRVARSVNCAGSARSPWRKLLGIKEWTRRAAQLLAAAEIGRRLWPTAIRFRSYAGGERLRAHPRHSGIRNREHFLGSI